MRTHHLSIPTKSGFTLIELIVVIAVISLLMALLLPALRRARDAAQAAVCLSNQHQTYLLLAVVSHEQMRGRWFQASYEESGTIYAWHRYLYAKKYIADPKYVRCPSWAGLRPDPNPWYNSDNAYGMRNLGIEQNGNNTYSGTYSVEGGFSPAAVPLGIDSLQVVHFGPDAANPHYRQFYHVSSPGGTHVRHLDAANTFFLDGHIKALNVEALRALRDVLPDAIYHNNSFSRRIYNQQLELVWMQ